MALGLIAAGAAALLALVHALTADRIEARKQAAAAERLQQVIAAVAHDNDLLADRVRISDPVYFPGNRTVEVHRARLAGEPAAMVFGLLAPDGYNGAIALLVGVRASGIVTGVRVVDHHETPGLGDDIELDHSDWILGFDGKSLQSPPEDRWAVRGDGGDFDQFTGATITPRAVVRAVKRTLQYHAANRDRLYGKAPTPEHDRETGP